MEKPLELVVSAKKLIALWEKNGIEYAIAAEIHAEQRKKMDDRIFKMARPAGAGVGPEGLPRPVFKGLVPDNDGGFPADVPFPSLKDLISDDNNEQ